MDKIEKIDKSLEETAQQYAEGPECTWVGTTALEEAFKAGAEWAFRQGYSQEFTILYRDGVSDTSTQSRQMTLTMPVPNDFLEGDKVRIIIVKED